MSSIIIYGEEVNIKKKRIISPKTNPNPSNFYGSSKLEAEKKLSSLKSNEFRIVFLRPPMIYGPGSKGNFPQLVKLANNLPIFPNINNERSMLFIDNLCIFIKRILDDKSEGVFYPQNKEYVRTSSMVKQIANYEKKKIRFISFLNFFVIFLSYFPGKIGKLTNKAFGNLVYEQVEDNSDFIDFDESIRLSMVKAIEE